MRKVRRPSDYTDVGDGWKTLPKEMELACCSCSLVHDISFRARILRGKPKLQWKVDVNQEATAQLRRHKKKKRAPRKKSS